jgi:hypothetical protein
LSWLAGRNDAARLFATVAKEVRSERVDAPIPDVRSAGDASA